MGGVFHGVLWDQDSEDLGNAQSHGLVASGNQLAAWLANLVLSDLDAVASSALVGVHTETSGTNAADLGAEVLDAKAVLGFAGAQSFTSLEGGEDLVGLGIFIKTHNFYLSKV